MSPDIKRKLIFPGVTEYVDLEVTSDQIEWWIGCEVFPRVNFALDSDSSIISEDFWVDIREKMRKRKK